METKDNKRYFIGVMIPAKTFFDNLDSLCALATKHNLGDVIFNTRTRMAATKRVVIQYMNANCALEKLRGRHFDAVFYFDERYRAVLDVRVTEIRDDNYLDYILEKEGVVNHGRGM